MCLLVACIKGSVELEQINVNVDVFFEKDISENIPIQKRGLKPTFLNRKIGNERHIDRRLRERHGAPGIDA